MTNTNSENSLEKVCNYRYLLAMTGGKEQAIKDITDTFLSQISEELKSINDAILKSDYVVIKSIAHTMQSTVTIMGIAVLAPVLREMESLSASASGSTPLLTSSVEKIKSLNEILNVICKQAIDEIERDKYNFI